MEREYRYFAVVNENHSRDDPFRLVRGWGATGRFPNEEIFTPRLTWERDDLLERIHRGSVFLEAEEISKADAERALEVLTRRFTEEMNETRRIVE